jgi:AraC-like DNA-binding protein
MTGGANSLTERVIAPAAQSSGLWSMPAGDARVFIDSLRRLDYHVEPLVAAAGVRERDLRDPDLRVSCQALGTIISGAQQQRFTPNLPLELARVTPIGAYPLLDYLVLTSETVGAGVRQLAHYNRIIGNPVDIECREAANAVHVSMARAAGPFSIEFTAALIALHFRNETDGQFAATRVTFQHKVDDASAYERVLGCPIDQAGSWNGVSMTLDSWQLPLRRRDPVLRQLLETQADEILARQPQRTGLALQVQRTLASRVAGGDTSIASLARELAMSGRTLQRRLAAEGVSYHALLEEARKAAASRYLSESTLAICEVAYLVGYSEPAPFHRAFKRWFGKTPEAFRSSKLELRS